MNFSSLNCLYCREDDWVPQKQIDSRYGNIVTYLIITTFSKNRSILRCQRKRRQYFSSFKSLIIGLNETAFPAKFPATDQSKEMRRTNSMKLTTTSTSLGDS